MTHKYGEHRNAQPRLQAYPEHKCSHQYHSRGHVRLQTFGIGFWDADFVTQVHASGTLGAGIKCS